MFQHFVTVVVNGREHIRDVKVAFPIHQTWTVSAHVRPDALKTKRLNNC